MLVRDDRGHSQARIALLHGIATEGRYRVLGDVIGLIGDMPTADPHQLIKTMDEVGTVSWLIHDGPHCLPVGSVP
jgi:hypothetical protein